MDKQVAQQYDAFISYSHAADGALAPALQKGLHRLAKPWYALRALRVFRDETNLAAEPGLWPTIQAALSESRFLILMASPAAARSKWVVKELDWWLTNREVDHLLLVLSEGEMLWDDGSRDFDWSRTDALPRELAGRFGDEPRYVDLRWARNDARLTLDHPMFRGAVLDLAAPIHGSEKDLLDGEDVRQFRRTKLLARSAAAGLAALTLASVIAAAIALKQGEVAQAQARVALARQLAAESGLLLRQSPDRLPLAVLLALESVDRYPSLDGNRALRDAVTLLPELAWSSRPVAAPERGRVRAIVFSSSGALLAAAREDGTAEVLDLHSRETRAVVSHDADPGAATQSTDGGIRWKAPGVDAEVVALAFSPDGNVLATGSNDHSARLWSTADGHQIALLEHGDSVASVAFHPRRAWLATGSKDGNARLWSITDGRLLHRFAARDEVRAVAFSPDGQYLAAIDTGSCVQLVDLRADAMPVRKWCGGSSGLGLAFSADSKRLATTTGDLASVFNVANGRLVFQATHLSRRGDNDPEHFKWIDEVAFSPDGEWLASAGRDGSARVWDLVSGQEVVRLHHQAGVRALAFGANGAQLLTASYDGTARVWDLPSGLERLRDVHLGGSEVVTFSPQANLVASGGVAGTIALWRLTSADRPLDIRHAGDATAKAISAIGAVRLAPDGRRLASVDENGELRVWSADGALLQRRSGLYGADALIFSEDGRHLAVRARKLPVNLLDLQHDLTPIELVGARDASDVVLSSRYIAARDHERRRLLLWRTAGGAALTVDDDTDPWDIRVDASMKHIATLHEDDRGAVTVRVRTLPDLHETGRIAIEGHGSFSLSPDGTVLAVSTFEPAGGDGKIQRHVDLFDVASGLRKLRLDEDRSLSWLLFSPDGRRVLTVGESSGDQRRELRVWRVADGKLDASLRHENEIDDLRVSPNSDVVATRTGTQIRLWLISGGSSGAPLSEIDADRYFSTYAFTPDGLRLLTGSRDGRVVSWLWRTEDLRNEACRRLTRNIAAEEWARYLGDRPYRATCAAASASAGRNAFPALRAANVSELK